MPPLTSTTLLHRNSLASAASNTSAAPLQVVCAWPVSGQYGIGARVLYYVLVATCIFAQKEKWLRGVCLAATLLVPAVAAIHGIVLAAVHVDGAVDMDVYGAFQLCSIGILAAPVTVKLSRTYFNDPGRNTIFVWAGLILAGLLSLTVEFYRSSPTPCPNAPPGVPFHYGTEKCGLVCLTGVAPISPIRGGSGNNIDVIPAPNRFTFNTATLIAAACCIPAILLLIAMYLKIIETNAKKQDRLDQGLESTGQKQNVSKVIKWFRKFCEVPVFGAAIVAIVIIGEHNFASPQVKWDNEPMANIGQWAPIVGITLALLGSLYLVLADALQQESLSHKTDRNDAVSNGDPSGSDRTVSQEREKDDAVTEDIGPARKVARFLIRISKYLGASTPAPLDSTDFRRGRAGEYPDIPGEVWRNRDLSRIRTQYSQNQEPGVSFDQPRSRAASFTGSVASESAADVQSSRIDEASLARQDTLEVPSPVHKRTNSVPVPTIRPVVVPYQGPPTPTIVVSASENLSAPAPPRLSEPRPPLRDTAAPPSLRLSR